MKYIVEYKLHGGQKPYFVEDGGYFAAGGKFIGITRDDADCHIPRFVKDGGDLVNLTEAELAERVKALKIRTTPLTSGKDMEEAEKTTIVANWLSEKGVKQA